jgi:beta-glucosidase/6-phospho-beta-glucosidase/beta-galactosidase
VYDVIHAADTVDVGGDQKAARVGLVPNLVAMKPSNPDNPKDIVAAEHLSHVYNRVFLEATINGKLDRNLDGIFEETRDDMKGRMDWIGINYYTRILAKATPIPGADKLYPYLDASPDLAAGVWQDYPEGIAEVVTWAAQTYKLPVIITENGTAMDKSAAWDSYLRPHLMALHGAMQQPDVEVLGYFVWSLLDNYEWNHGMAMRFGMFAVDETPAKVRTLTPAGAAYGEAARRNGFD